MLTWLYLLQLSWLPVALGAGNAPGWSIGVDNPSEDYLVSVSKDRDVSDATYGRGVGDRRPYPYGESDWSVYLSLTERKSKGPDSKTQYRTTILLELDGWEGVPASTIHPSWQICNTVYWLPLGRHPNPLPTYLPTGGPSSLTSSDGCILSTNGDRSTCPRLRINDDAACTQKYPYLSSRSEIVTIDEEIKFNRSDSLVWRDVLEYGGPGINSTKYDELLNTTFIVALAYTRNPNDTTPLPANVTAPTSWLVLQPSDFSLGSRKGPEGSAAASIVGTAAWVGAVAAVTVSFLQLY